MHAMTGLFLAACILLVVGGAWKLRKPDPATRALSGVGLPGSPLVVRALGAVEVALGVTAAVSGTPWRALWIATIYLGFALFALVARARPVVASCGCFGDVTTPPSSLHVFLDLILAAGAASMIGAPGPVLPTGQGIGADLALILWSALLAWMFYLAMTELPRTIAAART